MHELDPVILLRLLSVFSVSSVVNPCLRRPAGRVATSSRPAGSAARPSTFRVGGLFLHEPCGFELAGRGVDRVAALVRRADALVRGAAPAAARIAAAGRLPRGHGRHGRDRGGRRRSATARVLLRTSQGVAGGAACSSSATCPKWSRRRSTATRSRCRSRCRSRSTAASSRARTSTSGRSPLKKGQTVTARGRRRRLGSPLDAQLEVRDPTGKLVAKPIARRRRDPRSDSRPPRTAMYHVRITDARGDGGPAFVYRLTLTTGRRGPCSAGRPARRRSDLPDRRPDATATRAADVRWNAGPMPLEWMTCPSREATS